MHSLLQIKRVVYGTTFEFSNYVLFMIYFFLNVVYFVYTKPCVCVCV